MELSYISSIFNRYNGTMCFSSTNGMMMIMRNSGRMNHRRLLIKLKLVSPRTILSQEVSVLTITYWKRDQYLKNGPKRIAHRKNMVLLVAALDDSQKSYCVKIEGNSFVLSLHCYMHFTERSFNEHYKIDLNVYEDRITIQYSIFTIICLLKLRKAESVI